MLQKAARLREAAVLVCLVVAGCGGQPTATESVAASLGGATPQASPSVSAMDIGAIVIPPAEPPGGMTLSDEGAGPAVLEQLPLFPDSASQLQATPGFVDGRWSRFAGSESDFENSRGFILTWLAEYTSEDNANSAFAILLNELQSEDHYGWGIGEDAGLGDEGTCLDGENPQLGGLQETICVWRRGPLVMVVGGGSDNETPVETDAAAMDERAAALIP